MTLPPVHRCPAKVNLTLSVGTPRAGDRMHPICSWMVRVSLYDDLTVIPRAAGSGPSVYDIAFADDAPQPGVIDWPEDKDLAVRAHRLLEREAGRELPLNLIVRKRIPVGAGLAGGSSNAATAMLAINDAFGLNIATERLAELSRELGSDIPFFFGPPSAVISGVGNVIEPAPLDHALHLVLVLSPLSCNTGAVYRAFDELRPDASVRTTGPGDDPFNDLDLAAYHVEPRLGEVRDQCVEATGRDVHVTGSGAALFIFAHDAPDAAALAAAVRERLSVPAVPVHTL